MLHFHIHHVITLNVCRSKGGKRVSVSVHLCSDAKMLMLLLWALSSTLSISVYNVEERPSNSRELRGRRESKTDRSPWRIVLFWEKPAGLSAWIWTFVEDQITSCWSHHWCCHEFRLTPAMTVRMSRCFFTFVNDMSLLHLYFRCCLI